MFSVVKTATLEISMIIDLLAYKHHTRWLKICEDNLDADVRDWQKDFGGHIRRFRVVGWEAKAELNPPVSEDPILALNPCRFCKGKHVKIPTSPDYFYGKGKRKPSWNAQTSDEANPHSCGMNTPATRYPLLDLGWGNVGQTCPTAEKFLEEAQGGF